MKKIFTLIAAAFMAVGANAQDMTDPNLWFIPKGELNAADLKYNEGAMLLDNDYAKINTANNDAAVLPIVDEAQNPITESVGGYEFSYKINVRVDAAPTTANPTGTPHTGDDGNANVAIVVEAKKNTDVIFYVKVGATKSFDGYNQTTGETVSGNLVADDPELSWLQAAITFQLKGGCTYTFYTRGGTTGLYAIETTGGTYEEPSTNIYANAAASTVDGFSTMTYADGAKIALTGNADKAFSSGSSITIDGKNYTSTKVSNGAANTFYAPAGQKVYTFTIYSYVNIDAENRTPYWAQVGDYTYTADDANIMKSYKDGKNPDINTYTFAEGLSEVIFKNAGEQACFVLEVNYNAPDPSGIKDATSENVAAKAVKMMKDGRLVIVKGGAEYSVSGTLLK